MKIPCEIVVWYLLPTIRKGMARELVANHGYTQSKVARTFGVTDAAVSQYLRNKRGEYDVVVNSPG
ncbi:MAG: transcriptional regulator, partial [Candidatus Methanomethylophilaceae archaeon]|nr:transcriptional regulator [Candidatus Methanomethylophilaceae archaeon]